MHSSSRICRTSISWAALFTLACPMSANGRLLSYRFEGVIVESDYNLVDIGDTFAGTFSYDPAQPDFDSDQDRGFYAEPFGHAPRPFDIVFTAGSFFFNSDLGPGNSTWTVMNGASDTFAFSAGAFLDPTAASSFRSGSVTLTDATGTVFSSDAFPVDLSLAAFSEHRFTGTVGISGLGGDARRFSGDIDTLELIPIPEPHTLLLVGLALLGLAWNIRRCRGAKSIGPAAPCLAVILIALVTPLELCAQLVTYEFAGVIDETRNNVYVPLGTPFTGTFTYDLALRDKDDDPNVGQYGNGPWRIFVPLPPATGHMAYTAGPASYDDIDLIVDWAIHNETSDSFVLGAGNCLFSIGGCTLGEGRVSLVDFTGGVFDSDQTPAMLNLADFRRAPI